MELPVLYKIILNDDYSALPLTVSQLCKIYPNLEMMGCGTLKKTPWG